MENMIDEDDEDNNDWWTKYFASLEAAAEVSIHFNNNFP